MGKKRNRQSTAGEPDEVGQPSRKKQKRSEPVSSSPTKPSRNKVTPAQPTPRNNVSAHRGLDTPSFRTPAVSIAERPSGTHASQKKRAKKRQNKAAKGPHASRTPENPKTTIKAPGAPILDSSVNAKPPNRSNPHQEVDLVLLRRITTTKLVAPPKKRWVEPAIEDVNPSAIAGAPRIAPAHEASTVEGKPSESLAATPQTDRLAELPFGSETAMIIRELESPEIDRRHSMILEGSPPRSEASAQAQELAAEETGVESDSGDDADDDEEPQRVRELSANHSHPDRQERERVTREEPASTQLPINGDSDDASSAESTTEDDAADEMEFVGSIEPVTAAPRVSDDESDVDSSESPSSDEESSDESESGRAVEQVAMQPQVVVEAENGPMEESAQHARPPSPIPSVALSLEQQRYHGVAPSFAPASAAPPKANSVPNRPTGEDVREVFKRFSAFVKGRDGDSSDEDDDDGDSSEDESGSESDGDENGDRGGDKASTSSIVATNLLQPKEAIPVPVVHATEAEVVTRLGGEDGVDERPTISWAAINHVQIEQKETITSTEVRNEQDVADATEGLPDDGLPDDGGDVDRAQTTLSVLDSSNDIGGRQATVSAEVVDSGDDESASDSDDEQDELSDDELPALHSPNHNQAARSEQPPPEPRKEEIGNSSEDADLDSSIDGDAAESLPESGGKGGEARLRLSGFRETSEEAHSSQQLQINSEEIIEISSDSQSESDLASSHGDINDSQDAIDSPMQPVQPAYPGPAAQLNNELAVASQQSLPAPSRQANVGKKRQVSLLDNQIGGTGFGQDLMGEPLGHSQPSILDDADEDVYKTIDEVAKNLFGSTRPLPSKPEQSPNDGEDARLTSSSDHDVKSANVRRRFATEVSVPKPTAFALSEVIVCYSVRVPEFDNGIVAPLKASSTVDDNPELEGKHLAAVTDEPAVPSLNKFQSSSSLSELSRTPSPPAELLRRLEVRDKWLEDDESEFVPEVRKKRRMTGMTSKHFSPAKRPKSRLLSQDNSAETSSVVQQAAVLEEAVDAAVATDDGTEAISVGHQTTPPAKKRTTKPKRKSTGTKSDHFLPFHLLDRVDLPTPTKGRVPAGVSRAPVPSINSERFGIIQEKLWDQPFWLLVAVTFLNKTTGRAAVPTFWALKERYPTPEALAGANQQQLHDMIKHLGLQNQRSKRLIKMSQGWLANPPVAGKRYKTVNYPAHADHREYNRIPVIEEDATDCKGALEIGHIPGCGAYAWDSWRMFCRDALRGVADDYNGKGAQEEGFQPEWQRVLANDKELRATLRWMWLREGWIWNHETGEKRRATEEEMERAVNGQMDVPDPAERKFAAQAAGVETATNAAVAAGAEAPEAEREGDVGDVGEMEAKEDQAALPKAQAPENASDEIIVKAKRKVAKRSSRRTTIA